MELRRSQKIATWCHVKNKLSAYFEVFAVWPLLQNPLFYMSKLGNLRLVQIENTIKISPTFNR